MDVKLLVTMGYDNDDLWLCLGHCRPPVCLYNYGKLLHLREWRTSLLFIWAKLFFNKCLSGMYVRMRNSKDSRAKTKRHSHGMRMRVPMRTHLLHKCNFLPNVPFILSFCPHTNIRASVLRFSGPKTGYVHVIDFIRRSLGSRDCIHVR